MMVVKDTDTRNDEHLIELAVNGNKKALETLIKRYQDFIYNVSLKMFLHRDDALDATQELLIKVITNLNTFKRESKFSTWLYRITVNHFLNSPERKMEKMMEQNAKAFNNLANVESTKEADESEIEEVRIMCSTGMLLCLNREQRLLYLISEVFEASHTLGAELFSISPANYRVKVHRAKTDLLNYISGKCGLVDVRNPCRCSKKARGLVEQGAVDKNKLLFNKSYTEKIYEIVERRKDELCDDIELRMKHLFTHSPFQIRDELDGIFKAILP